MKHVIDHITFKTSFLFVGASDNTIVTVDKTIMSMPKAKVLLLLICIGINIRTLLKS